MSLMLTQGNALRIPLADESVHCVVTSPPYWGLRDYGTATWEGGDPKCDHIEGMRSSTYKTDDKHRDQKARELFGVQYRDTCGKCGAIRIDNQLGLEPTPELYVANMVEVFREVKRVLRADGTLWLNLGSSYASGDMHSNQSRHYQNDQSCDSDGIKLLYSQVLDYACRGLCDEHLSDFLIHLRHIENIDQLHQQSSSQHGQINHDSEHQDFVLANLDSSALSAQVSTILLFWRQLRGECLRCDSRVSFQLELGLISSDVLAFYHKDFDHDIDDTLLLLRSSNSYNNRGIDSFSLTYPYSTTLYLKPKDLIPIPWMIAMALQADGWYLRSDIIWSKKNPMPESVTDRPTKAHEYLFLLTKSARYYYDADAVREPIAKATISRNLYPHHGSKNAEGAYSISRDREPGEFGDEARGRNKRTVWSIPTKSFSGAHFATYPPALVEPCIKAGSSERGVCPECGSPWERVTETKGGTIGKSWHPHSNDLDKGMAQVNHMRVGSQVDAEGKAYSRTTLGWRPTCDHYPHTDRWREFPSQGEMTDVEYYWSTLNVRLERKILVEFWRKFESVPATVFDPFIGSGTTLQVARALGRNGIGLDLSLEYLHLARKRLSLDALDAWGKAKKDGKAVTDLPMFGGQDEPR